VCVRLPLAEHRGASLLQLRRVITFIAGHCCKWSDASGSICDPQTIDFHELAEWVLRPSTTEDGCSFIELLATGKQPPVWHVSHAWTAGVLGCWECIELHAEHRRDEYGETRLTEETPYWLYALAMQPATPFGAPSLVLTEFDFYMPLKIAEGCLLIVSSGDEAGCDPFARTWCLLETWMCTVKLHKSLDIATYQNSGTYLLTDGLTAEEKRMERKSFGNGIRHKYQRETGFPVHCKNLLRALGLHIEESITTENEDRTTILNWISGREDMSEEPLLFHHTYTKASVRLRASIATLLWPVWARSQTPPPQLSPATSEDKWRSLLKLSFSFCGKIGDAHLAALGEGIPSTLQELDLNLRQCEQLSDGGIAALAGGWPATLKALRLDLCGCAGIHNLGIHALADALPRELWDLQLFLAECIGVTSEGVASIVERLPSALRCLRFDFSDVERVDDAVMLMIGHRLSRELLCLQLVADSCMLMTDEAVEGIAKRLPQSLQMLRLSFSNCKHITDQSLTSIAMHLPSDLLTVNLSFVNCKRVTDGGSALLVQKMPRGVDRAAVNLAGTTASTSRLRWSPAEQASRLRRGRVAKFPSNGFAQPPPRPIAFDGLATSGRELDVLGGSTIEGAAPVSRSLVRLPSIGLQLSSGGDTGMLFDELGEGDLNSRGQSNRTTQKQKTQQKYRSDAIRQEHEHTYPRWCPAIECQSGESMFRMHRTTSAPELIRRIRDHPLWLP
jgi:hypothetical protein